MDRGLMRAVERRPVEVAVQETGSAGSSAVARDQRRSWAFTGIHKAVLVLSAVGLLTASAYVSVPFFPVPLTMQTLAVLLVGGLLGPTLGVSAVMGYLLLGAAGAPVFHNGLGGLAVLVGPTGGYLVGFIGAAFVMGLACKGAGKIGRRAGVTGETDRGPLAGAVAFVVLVLGVLVASVTVYAVGVPWLAVFTGSGLETAVTVGAVPFLLGDLLKGAVAVAALRLGGGLFARKGLLLH